METARVQERWHKGGSTCCLGNQTGCVIPKHACRNWSYVIEKVTSFTARQVILDLQKITDFIYLSGCQSARWLGKSQSDSAVEAQRLFNTWMQTGTLSAYTVYRKKEHKLQSQYTYMCVCSRFGLCSKVNKLRLPHSVMHRAASAAQWWCDGCDYLWD